MLINWFPGHMTKALRAMQEETKNIDVFIYVLDSRAPMSSINPKFREIIGEKPIIYVFNKYDLCDAEETRKFFDKIKNPSCECVFMNASVSGASKILTKLITELSKAKIEKLAKKGVKPILKAMILGVPNSGKSTLVNNLCREAKAITGDKAGVTRGKQWVRIGDGSIEVLDTPGTLWPSFSDERVAKHLAYIGSIKDDVYDKNELALEFVKDLQKLYPTALEKRYNTQLTDVMPLEQLEKIAEARKYLIKGGEIDYDRVCQVVIDDFRKGYLGKITLDR